MFFHCSKQLLSMSQNYYQKIKKTQFNKSEGNTIFNHTNRIFSHKSIILLLKVESGQLFWDILKEKRREYLIYIKLSFIDNGVQKICKNDKLCRSAQSETAKNDK